MAFNPNENWVPPPCSMCRSRELAGRLSEENLAVLAEYRTKDQKINAIKAAREYLNLSLRDAMEWGDAYFVGGLDAETGWKAGSE